MASLSSVLKLTLLDGVTGPARRIQGVLSGLQRQQTAMLSPLRGITGSVLAFGAGYVGLREGIGATVGAAIKFESAFADVKKVVDGSDEQLAGIARSIKLMSRELPMASTEIAALYAAAAESGVATNDLQAFSKMAGQVAIAFDMSAGEAGESLAKLKTQFGLTVAETGDLADSINHLSNGMASKASEITEYLLRVGSLAEMGGFAKEEVAALGSAMIAAGADASTAGTAMQNVVKAMTRGGSAKKSQKDAARALGLDLPQIAKDMQKDAPGALKTVLKAIAKAPKDRHISLLSDFFGDEAKAFLPLVGNIGLLDQALFAVADRSKYTGSAFKEFVARAGTTGNALQILRNKIDFVFEDIGEGWLPTIKEGTTAIGEVLDTLGDRASIFDETGAGVSGFMQGLGYKGGVKEGIKGLGDLLFGEVDPDGAADRIGGIFAKFEGYGKAIREFNEDLKNNPIAQFLGDIAGKGLKLTLAAGGIALVAGAITTLATALAKITGVTTAIGIMRAVGKISGILKDVPIPNVPGDGKNKPAPDNKPGSWGIGWKGLLAAFQMVDHVAGIPSTKEGVEELYAKNRKDAGRLNRWLDERITTPSKWFQDTFVPLQPSADDDGGRAASMDSYLAGPQQTGGMPKTVDQLMGGLNSKPMSLDAGTIVQLLQPSRGVQEVRDVNRQQPVVNVHAPVSISNISSPQEAVDAAASHLGQRVKAAVESAYSD
ncbi:phage tail tape measure protein [Shinella sp. CPCC 100929]|uniref:Phage tail tape measure protein n=1 Tax=Shinella lacus TaxID=2654216 RepID=A0ABT1R3Z5_9HYPH|nr:phage tail tape measure protein [Shinella lacus]MCQ4629912.1 phage tail tape measure protein [Shinella lacus]